MFWVATTYQNTFIFLHFWCWFLSGDCLIFAAALLVVFRRLFLAMKLKWSAFKYVCTPRLFPPLIEKIQRVFHAYKVAFLMCLERVKLWVFMPHADYWLYSNEFLSQLYSKGYTTVSMNPLRSLDCSWEFSNANWSLHTLLLSTRQ